jgi:hypothetical protein
MKCQKNRVCAKQHGNSLPNVGRKCTGCDKTGKDVKELEKRVAKLERDLDFTMRLPIHTKPSKYNW